MNNMKILVVSATENEIKALKQNLEAKNTTSCGMNLRENSNVDFLVTGIGSVFTIYALLKKIAVSSYDLIINAGIAGSFSTELNIGDVVNVQSDQFADLGIEDKDALYTIFEKGYVDKNQFPFVDGKLNNPNDFDSKLRKVSAITVNTTHGNEKSIVLFENKFRADIESMEGAAVFYVCLLENIPFMQIRSISNYVEERNTKNWNIPLAIKNLNNKLLEIISDLENKDKNWQSF